MNTKPEKKLLFSTMTRKRIGILIASFIVCSASLTLLAFESSKKTVVVELDGEETVISTHAQTVGDVLAELNVMVKEHDYISHPLDTIVADDDFHIVWKPSVEITVIEDYVTKKFWTTAKTIKEFLESENIEIYHHDVINFSIQDPITERLTLKINRAFPTTVENGTEQMEVWTTSTTVAGLLDQLGITLGELDRVEPPLSNVVTPNLTVKVVRVEKVTDVVEEPIDFKVVRKNDASLLKGTEKVIQNGQKGLLKKTYEVTLENGEEVDRELVEEEVVKKSQDKIIAVGTKNPPKPKPKTTTKSSTTKDPGKGKEYVMQATAYTAYCNGCSGITATGINLRKNPHLKVIAVDPKVIPLGSKVWVEGYGVAVAADVGGAIKGNRIDVFIPNKKDAYRFGRRTVKVRVLD